MRCGPWFVLAVALLVAPRLARAEEETADELVLALGGAPLALRRVPRGELTQGSPPAEAQREPDEAERPVRISRDYWIGKTPVTRGQFAKFVAETRYLTEAEKGASGGSGWDGKQLVQKKSFTWRSPGFTQSDDHPVVLVTWGDANAFAAWASRKTGRRVRLPTEAEWEYAARAGTRTPWYSGATEEDALAIGWFKPNAGDGTRPVAQKKPNALGLFDMAGNVYEWCSDVYAPYPKGPALDPETTARVGSETERRVLRGGSWLKEPKRGRSAARYRNTAGSRNADNGFRVVVTDEEGLAPGPATGGGAAPEGPLAGAGHGDGPSAGDAPPEHGSSLWPLLLAPVAAAAGAVGWMLARRRSTPPGMLGVSTRAAADGFFVSAPGQAPGSRVRYECVVHGVPVTDVVPLDAGAETFVYTGGQPAAIRVVEIVPAIEGYRAPHAPTPPARTPPAPVARAASAPQEASTSDDGAVFLGYPRAY